MSWNHRRRRTLLALGACTLLSSFVLRRFLVCCVLTDEPERGTFERLGGREILAIAPGIDTDMFPSVDIYESGRTLGVAPGLSVSLHLREPPQVQASWHL